MLIGQNPHGGDIYERNIRLDYSANVNPFGTPACVKRAVKNAAETLSDYPDPMCRALVEAISEHEQVSTETILCGNGAAELIFGFADALRADRALVVGPTFCEYENALSACGTKTFRHTLTETNGFRLTETVLDAIVPGIGAVFVCNPNNPTGRKADRELLIRIMNRCEEVRAMFFVDECFLDWLGRSKDSLKEFLEDRKSLFLLKAFTKSYGMAGLRLGYCLSGNRELLERMSARVQPWNVSGPAQAAGIAALREGGPHLLRAEREIERERGFLSDSLRSLKIPVFESDANFLLFRARSGLDERLLSRGILIRNCSNFAGLETNDGTVYFRIAVKRHAENLVLVQTLREVL